MSNTCIVIIDMQKGFINRNTVHLIDKIKKFIEVTSLEDVIATRYINHQNTACYKFEGWKDCMEGTEDAEIVDELKPFIKKTFDKDKYSCWNAEFKKYVTEQGYDKLIFIGVSTGCCVLHSAFDAYNDLMDCEVIADMCGSTSGEASHQAALQVLRECITKERVINFGTDKKLNIKRNRYVVMTADKKEIFAGLARNYRFVDVDKLGDTPVKSYLSEKKAMSSFLQSWSIPRGTEAFGENGKYVVVPVNETLMEM